MYHNVSFGDMISNVMISNIDVPRLLVICLVSCPGGSSRVVFEQDDRLLARLLELS